MQHLKYIPQCNCIIVGSCGYPCVAIYSLYYEKSKTKFQFKSNSKELKSQFHGLLKISSKILWFSKSRCYLLYEFINTLLMVFDMLY